MDGTPVALWAQDKGALQAATIGFALSFGPVARTGKSPGRLELLSTKGSIEYREGHEDEGPRHRGQAARRARSPQRGGHLRLDDCQSGEFQALQPRKWMRDLPFR